MTSTIPYEILTGVGDLWIAPSGTAKPALNATPSSPWRLMGFTDDGVTVTKTRKIATQTVDQRTGKVAANVEEEGLSIETNLAQVTLENVADVMSTGVTDVAPGSGTIGYRKVTLYTGSEVTEFAMLFRGKSPYGASMPAQYYVPRGYMDDDVGIEHKKADKALIPVKFEALENLDAAQEEERFGVLEAQDAAALP